MGVEVDRSVETAEAGDGTTFPKQGDKVKLHYTGTLAADGSKFDSSRDRGELFEFTIGVGQVIKGWDEGVVQLSLGERATLRITSDFGYGSAVPRPPIPPDADLVFDVELLAIDGRKIEAETSPFALQVDGGRVAQAAGETTRELFAAIRAQRRGRVREILEMEADVNAYEPVPCPHPLQFLGWLLCLPFIVLMIICPCIGWLCIMLNDTDNYKKTPLHVAMTKDDPDMVALLLEFGADRNAPAVFLNCCCLKKTPTQFVDICTLQEMGPPDGTETIMIDVPIKHRAQIKELLCHESAERAARSSETPEERVTEMGGTPREMATDLPPSIVQDAPVTPAGAGGTYAEVSVAVVADPIKALTDLKELLDAGVITQADFDSKKAELLARI